MRKLAPLAALLIVAAVGCKPKLEDQVVGSWSGPNNSSVTVNKDKSWTSDIPAGGMTLRITGTWAGSGDTVTMTPQTVNDQPAAQVAKQMTDMGKKMGLPKAQLDQMNDLVSADDFKLSDDGKTLTLKNPRQGKAVTLTKK
jgi:hypothetical protein